jgi:hypothetical protein
MPDYTGEHATWNGLGMAALVLGMIGLVLFFLPILGIPVSACGLVCGVAGCCGAVAGLSLRWSLGGVALCSLALLVNFAIYYAPAGYLQPHTAPGAWNPVSDRPWVSPPSK